MADLRSDPAAVRVVGILGYDHGPDLETPPDRERPPRSICRILRDVRDHVLGRLHIIPTRERRLVYGCLATMVEAGLPQCQGLEIIGVQATRNPFLKAVLLEVASAVESGMALSEACRHHPTAFSEHELRILGQPHLVAALRQLAAAGRVGGRHGHS